MPPDPNPPKPRCPGSDGTDDYECPPPPSSNGNDSRRLVTPLVVTAFVVVFLFLASLSIYCFIRRRKLRRQQQSLLAAEVDNAGVQADGPEDEVVHHAWHIRTVGLDEAAIESIALTRYRAGAGTLGAADCSVCLGEFLDGELLRLLPKCGHAFHVPCIDTWLRAHVNCPLCRAEVVVDSAAAAGDSNTSADAGQVSSNTETSDHEHEQPGERQNQQQELRVQIDQCDQVSSLEPQRRRILDFRRVASMDSSAVSAEEVPEDKQSSKENQGNGDGACREVPSGSGRLCHMKRSLSGGGRWSVVSRHRRACSSLLPS
uniref:Uncharacterized protein n=1 Tax=Avena sativa TaxID=4498 RepID=A0ACD5ZFZ5_AVESA